MAGIVVGSGTSRRSEQESSTPGSSVTATAFSQSTVAGDRCDGFAVADIGVAIAVDAEVQTCARADVDHRQRADALALEHPEHGQ
ncbi:MAG: hypothetical protein WKF58_13225 [Ilumatobacteraceae bacterium]